MDAITFGITNAIRGMFLHLPYELVFLIIIVFFLSLTMGLYFLLPRIVRPTLDNDLQLRTAAILVGVVGAFYGMLFGLVNVNLWQNYHKMQDIVSQEASSLSLAVINSEALPDPVRSKLKAGIKDYIVELRDNEWSLMQRKQASQQAWDIILSLPLILQTYQPKNSFEQTYYNQTLSKIDDAIEYRRARVDAAQNSVPTPLLRVLVLGSFLLVLLLGLVVIKTGRGHYLLFMSLLVNALIAFNLYLVFDLDNNFAGRVTIESTPFNEGQLAKLMQDKSQN